MLLFSRQERAQEIVPFDVLGLTARLNLLNNPVRVDQHWCIAFCNVIDRCADEPAKCDYLIVSAGDRIIIHYDRPGICIVTFNIGKKSPIFPNEFNNDVALGIKSGHPIFNLTWACE